jgi:mono/diheme cytochrome c family protein
MALPTKRVGILIGTCALVLLLLIWAVSIPDPLAFAGSSVELSKYADNPTGVPADLKQASLVDRGKYLTEAADCEACHTVEGGQPFAGGLAFRTQFGTLYSPNITPDAQTGIGDWSDEDFVRTMHEGVNKNGEHLYPAFPYAAYTYLTNDDVLAIKAYLFSLPAVQKQSPSNDLEFPYNQRSLMRVWAAMYNPSERFEPVADRSASWNRGAYLVEALGHCGDCHTPRTALQALNNREKFAGGMAEGWRAYNISSHKEAGIGSWSDEELVQYLRTGRSLERGTAFGPMALAVHLSLQRLTESDVKAVVEYVRSVPAATSDGIDTVKTTPAPSNPLQGVVAGGNPRGAEIFAGVCSGCHGWTGVNEFVPYTVLTGNRAVNDPAAVNVALAVMTGANPLLPKSGAIAQMPSFAHMTDNEIAAVSNYVVERFGGRSSSITGQQVAKLREAH